MNWFSTTRVNAAQLENVQAVRNVKAQLDKLRDRMVETEKTAASVEALLREIGLQRQRRQVNATAPPNEA
jgi:hypothetical protein